MRQLPTRNCTKTHFGAGVGNADITARVALLRELTGEEFIEFRTEDTIGHELALLANLGGHFDSVGGAKRIRDMSVLRELETTSACANYHPSSKLGGFDQI